MNVFQLARLSLAELQGRYLQLIPADLRRGRRFGVLLEGMSREQLVVHILEATP